MDASRGDRMLLTKHRIWLVWAASAFRVLSRVVLPRQSYTRIDPGSDTARNQLIAIAFEGWRVDRSGPILRMEGQIGRAPR